MATLRKRNGKWQVQVRRNRQPPVSRTFTLKAEAQAWARQIELHGERADLPTQVAALSGITLSAIIIRYRNEVTPKKRSGKNEAIFLNAFLRNKLAQVQLNRLTPERFAAYRHGRLASVKPRSVK